ncbi:hypothetical protein HDC37_003058 [Microbacterium sp. AK009]|uniref:hypothetical protein n=1 Tax=Microbacterium sp. AK009 TaxID=2723068 RepID=UPI0015CAEF26|nr:hypothetical protein [Microbacterium sp. AK009]NYF18202.1 hypothetical protein [Microbacterium sp. AK009]
MTPPANSARPPLVDWALEYVEPEALGMNAKRMVPTNLMDYCRAAAGVAALDPTKVQFVFSGDVATSVQERLPPGPYRDSFNLSRGAGTMGAKTMRVDDEVHILFPAWLLYDVRWLRSVDPRDEEGRIANAPLRKQFTKRMAAHESGHVATFQAGEETEQFDDEPTARHAFLHAAQQIIDGYRAELVVPESLLVSWDRELSVETVTQFRSFLAEAKDEYPRSRDRNVLAHAIVNNHAQALWKVLACLAAVRRITGTEVGAPFPGTVTRTPEWSETLSAHWAQFEEVLSRVPSSRTRMSPAELRDRAYELADLLGAWLVTFGFVWQDSEGAASLRLAE